MSFPKIFDRLLRSVHELQIRDRVETKQQPHTFSLFQVRDVKSQTSKTVRNREMMYHHYFLIFDEHMIAMQELS
jgi:phage portal protein BeeE